MVRQILIQVALSTLPVLVFLSALELIDTYKLVTLRRVIRSIAIGAGVAIVCYGVNTSLYRTGIVAPEIWVRFGAPWLEEIAKALYVAWFRVGPAEAGAQPPKQHHVPRFSSLKTACDVVQHDVERVWGHVETPQR